LAVIALLTSANAGPPRKEDVPKLIGTLKTSNNAKLRAQAADDIAKRGAIRASDVDDAIDPLLNALKKDKDADVRRACAKALGNIGTNADKCVPGLADSLKDTSQLVKIAAIQALGQFGPEAESALPTLRELAAKKDDKKISPVAAAAVKAISGVEKKKK
jgi:HEAT repeat protein